MSDLPSPERWHELEPLLDAALDTPSDQRRAFLDDACAGDAELRAEIERLLRACSESEHFLKEPAPEFAAPIFATLADAERPASPGTRIGSYRIIEEAGRGGMAVVFLAERDDGEFQMRVALKLVRAGVILEEELLRRFREERQILASLEHPGIARLLDGGVTDDGLPWFAMEYVDGTPIERHCDDRRLSVEARLELFCAVCDAVQHAHDKGIVHRDLKPGNILVTGPGGVESADARVKLLDFGIAKLLAAPSTGAAAEQTRPELRLMTPEYASPEQIRGEAVTPAADVYSLGVLLYRLLCGRHPEQPADPRPLRRFRGDLTAIVLTALDTDPERRYRTSGEFGTEVRRHLRRGMRRRGAWTALAAGVATILLGTAGAAWFARNTVDAPSIDPDAIVVAPFHVAAEGAFDYLHEGLVDLLATSLNGESASRAVDPRAVLAAWRSSIGQDRDRLSPERAQRIAWGLGAGQLLMGSVVGTTERLTLNATLYDVVGSDVLARVSVHGPADSLLALVDGLAGQLLVREAGVPRHQLAAATTTSLPALRAYLAGHQSYRRGHFSEAVQQLEEALSQDSTFALAAIHLWRAVGSGPLTAAPGSRERALRLAWAERDRLSVPDRLFLEAIAGPRYPEPTPRHEMLTARTRAVDAFPDRPEALLLMGMFQLGGVLRDEVGARQRSDVYFNRAFALDSSYSWPTYYLVRGAAADGDSATVQRIVRRYLATDSASEMAHLLTWIGTAVSGDERAMADLRERMPAMHPTALGWIAFHALFLGLDVDGGEAALAALRATVRSDSEWSNYRFREWEYLGNRGRLAELRSRLETAAQEAGRIGPIEELGVSAELRARRMSAMYRIQTPLFWGGDTTGIGDAMTLVEDVYRRSPAPDGDQFVRQVVAESACYAGVGRLAVGDVPRARAAAGRLRDLLDGDQDRTDRNSHALCAATLDALIAVEERSPDARRRVELVDAMLRQDVPDRRVLSRTQLLLARAYDALGDPESGLRVIRRREWNNPAFFLATILAEEGRLAARAGDTEGAIRAYRHYLVLRTEPDPDLVPEVQRVREELTELLADPIAPRPAR